MRAIRYFNSGAAFREWLDRQGGSAREIWVGFHKVKSGRARLTYHDALDEALCYGWIDGVRRSVDERRYTIRFTPRTPASNWSVVNIARAEALIAEGRMREAGLHAFAARRPRAARYSYENRPDRLDRDLERVFKKDDRAWTFFAAQPPSYRRTAIWYVMSAVKSETRLKRLRALMTDSASARRIGLVTAQKRAAT